MTDKQIIIDGVNVVKCPHRKKEVTFMNVIKCYNYGACEGVNCLYKQLKAKEQECKALREEKVYNNMACEQFKKQLQSKEQECNQLKVEIDKKELIFAGIETSNKLLIEKNNKLKQTLTEIKEIAEENLRIADSEGLNGVYRRGLAEQILQKISGCEVENEN